MGLLQKLMSEGSQLTNYDGATPTSYNGVGVLNPASFVGSQLDLNGETPLGYAGSTGMLNPASCVGSQLDLGGVTPPQYLDNLPE